MQQRYVSNNWLLSLLVSVSCLSGLVGCVTVPLAPTHLDEYAKKFTPPLRHGRVYCYRKYEYFACAITLPLTVDGRHSTELAPNTYTYLDLAPGSHTFATTGPFASPYSVNLNIQPQTQYFLRQDPRMGYVQNQFHLIATDEVRAKNDLKKCRLVQTFNSPSGTTLPKSRTTTHGTGFAVSPSGHVLTAYHVVENADQVHVRFGNDDWQEARVLSHSRAFDVALLKIPTGTPAFLSLSPPDSVRQGQEVFTIGYPVPGILGVQPKYANGVISSETGLSDEASLLQMTVPIQPGNSGGALVAPNGEVVGIVTSSAAVRFFLATTGTIPQNVNWAVNADYFRPLVEKATASAPREAEIKSTKARDDVVSLVRNATCLVQVESRR